MGLTFIPISSIVVVMKWHSLQTVVETSEFINQTASYMDDETRNALIDFIAGNPCAGDLIQSTGGVRKIRWQADSHRGKRGGARVIYYYHDQDMPIFLLTAYKKNQKENLTSSDKAAFRKVISKILEVYER